MVASKNFGTESDLFLRMWGRTAMSPSLARQVLKFGWTKEDEEGLLAECAAEIDRAAEEYLATPAMPVEAMFDQLYEELPPAVEAQRRQAIREAAADA